MAGLVLADEKKITKSGTLVDENAVIRLLGSACPYVGRGGLKLARALEAFDLDVREAVCLDLGASTGGFTDCLLQAGAAQVVCVDVGRGQLDWKLRSDPRVCLREGINARYLTAEDFPDVRFRFVVMDLSFISLKLVLPAVRAVLSGRGEPRVDVVALVKPQFEAGRQEVGKGGVVRDEAIRRRVLDEVAATAETLGFSCVGWVESPITGADGNVEYLLHVQVGSAPGDQPENTAPEPSGIH